MTQNDLKRMRDWANQKLAVGDQPPWAWYQYMKLRETLDALIEGSDATKPLRLVSDNDRIPVVLPC